MTALPAFSSNGAGAVSGAIAGPSWSAKSRNCEMRRYQLELFFLKGMLTEVIIGGVCGHGLLGNADRRTRSRCPSKIWR
jgi:hypothetical protein